jgi:hypothetical protein
MQPPGVLKSDGRSFKPADSRDNRFRSSFGQRDCTRDPAGYVRANFDGGAIPAGERAVVEIEWRHPELNLDYHFG